MAKFKDKHSGSVVEFKEKYDIEQMRVHPDYDEVLEEDKKDNKAEKPSKDK